LELTEVLRTLWARKLATALAIIAAFGAAAAIRLALRDVPTGAATVQILVDSPHSLLGDLDQSPTPLIARAGVFAQVMASQAVLPEIAEHAGIPASEITAQGPYSGAGETLAATRLPPKPPRTASPSWPSRTSP
jgi:uncharacterized protein involved in exopolysaccharide biosynthesis